MAGTASASASQAWDKEPSECDSTSDILWELIQQKKSLLMGRRASLDSEAESDVCSLGPSEAGSITTNPRFQRGRGIFSSIRSAVFDHDLDGRSGAALPSPELGGGGGPVAHQVCRLQRLPLPRRRDAEYREDPESRERAEFPV